MKILTPARITLLMFLVVGLLVAAYIGKTLLATEETPPEIDIETIPMAMGDLQPGTVLTEAHIGTGRIRVDQLEPDMLLSDRVIVGRVVKEPIAANSPFRAAYLYAPGERPPLPVADGMRAVSIPLQDDASMVDGFIRPGQYVDVHLTVESSSDPRLQNGLTITLFKGIRVLAINQSQYGSGIGRNGNSVTVELTPAQANVLIQAQKRGQITMSYNPEGAGTSDVRTTNADRVTLEEILNLAPLPEAVRPFQVEAYSGASRGTIEFRNGRRVDDDSSPPAPQATPDPLSGLGT